MSKRLTKAFLILTLSVCSLICSIFGFEMLSVSAESSRQIITSGSTSVQQGSSGYCYVEIDSVGDLSALEIAVYFNSDDVKITSYYNSVTNKIYDSAKTESCLQFSYIFDGKGATTKTRLFYFYYQILPDATVGETCFDIVIGDAYNSALEPVSVIGTRRFVTVTEKVATNKCTISSTSTISTSVKSEFTLSYKLSSYKIASGALSVSFDSELFEVVSVVNGTFLNNKAVDVNANLNGSVYLSFVGTEYVSKYDLLSITFRTKKNVNQSSDIKLSVTEFYDLDLNLISCSGYTTKANVVFDSDYAEDSPAMSVSLDYISKKNKLIATVNLASNSMLGAGDFLLSFDKNVLSFVGYEKGFSPSFFNVNTKEQANGIIKFSIISMTNIVSSEKVICVTFNVLNSCNIRNTNVEILGSGLTDSLTNSILLNFVNANIELPAQHAFGEWGISTNATSQTAGIKTRKCLLCNTTETQEIPALGVVLDDEIKFGHSCSFHNNLTMNYYVPESCLTNYDNFYLSVEKDTYVNGELVVETSKLQGELTVNGWKFVFKGIGAAEAGNELRAVLYAEFGEIQYKSKVDVYNVKEYAYSRLEKSTDAEFKTLLVDMLNYCSAAQIYFSVNTDNLVNADLTAEQQALATQSEVSVKDTSSVTTLDGATARIVGKSIVFNSNIEVKFYIDLSAYKSLDNIKLRVSYTDEVGKNHIITVKSDDFVFDFSVGYYTAKIIDLNSAELRVLMCVEIICDDSVISDTVYYSVETYVYNRLNKSTDVTFKTLLKELMKYSDSANKYFY